LTTALEGVSGLRHAPAAFSPWKDPVPIVQEAGWATGPDWRNAENFAPTGIRFPDVGDLYENLSTGSKFDYNRAKMSGTLH